MPTITRDELRTALAEGGVTLVDARAAAPYRQCHLPGARHLAADAPEDRVREVLPDPAATVVTYSTDASCTHGPELAERLRALGYADVRVYPGGIEDWVGAGLPPARPDVITLRLQDLMLSPTAALFQGDKDGGGVNHSIFVTRTPPGRFVELHTHPYSETFLLLAGRGRWTIGDTVVELEPDGMAIAPPMTLHGFRNVGDEPLLVVSVHERGTLSQEFTEDPPA
jgi:mannose-6-phosphate isomerase-like protein (cupin superfamily)/rhodanese-related sulfurtransferase